MFPEAAYALAKLINLTHTPPADEVDGAEIAPVPQPVVPAVPERWRRVWEVWTNAVRVDKRRGQTLADFDLFRRSKSSAGT